MTKDNKIIEASNKFRPEQAEARLQASEQQRKDGAQIIRKLNRSGFKVPPQEREKLARNIGQLVHENGIKRQILALEAGMDSKEIYRLTIKRNGETPSDKNRLRAKGQQYLGVITAIAKIAKLDRADLASRVTYGTSIHPSSSPASSEIEWLMQRIYDLVDGIEEEFNLLNRFKALSQMKAACKHDDAFALWPSEQPNRKERITLPEEKINQASFWGDIFAHQKNSDQYMEFDNPDWPHVIGFLPHMFLGLDNDFDLDYDYWVQPSDAWDELKKYREENPDEGFFYPWFGYKVESLPIFQAWKESIRERLVDYIGGVSTLNVTWDYENNQFMFSGNPATQYLKKLHDYGNDMKMESIKTYRDGFYGEDYPLDSIPHYWIGIYPNKTLTGMIPVLITTNHRYFRDNFIETLSATMLENLFYTQLVDGESIGSRIRRAIEITLEDEEPMLKAEWRRTALFIEHHPLLMKQKIMKQTEDHISKWREGIHKS